MAGPSCGRGALAADNRPAFEIASRLNNMVASGMVDCASLAASSSTACADDSRENTAALLAPSIASKCATSRIKAVQVRLGQRAMNGWVKQHQQFQSADAQPLCPGRP